ncbi:hypothetical protein GCM10012287_04960 [Streptomyces daqingensis]|uniref:Uncharacterized protein n=1 Tax=Streptomyces daqingensis TaxID=1472640 RepID=A0ABQ2LTA1_9ACTN|nr:hypothetical protein GCM10012287_04960 [Streptomyces daqingensis]
MRDPAGASAGEPAGEVRRVGVLEQRNPGGRGRGAVAVTCPGLTARQLSGEPVRPTLLSCVFLVFEFAGGGRENRCGNRPKRCLDKG